MIFSVGCCPDTHRLRASILVLSLLLCRRCAQGENCFVSCICSGCCSTSVAAMCRRCLRQTIVSGIPVHVWLHRPSLSASAPVTYGSGISASRKLSLLMPTSCVNISTLKSLSDKFLLIAFMIRSINSSSLPFTSGCSTLSACC